MGQLFANDKERQITERRKIKCFSVPHGGNFETTAQQRKTQSTVVSRNEGDRGRVLRRGGSWNLWDKVPERRELYRERTLKICTEVFLIFG